MLHPVPHHLQMSLMKPQSPKPPVEANADEDIRSSAPVQGFESDEILAPRKRAKTNQIVQDSDEEAEGD
jgi:fanconi anemia group I protein